MTNISAQQYNVIGIMSGTSLDGVDLAFCRFIHSTGKWSFEIVCAQTIPYSASWRQAILNSENTDALTFQQTHTDYGLYLGGLVSDFIIKNSIKVDFVASHGHTIFHQPEKKLTVQLGAGNAIAAKCKLPVVCDFRSLDVALGGQGAPLVPIGDKLLFPEFDYCLNLGGFANVSYEYKDQRIAYDICPVNIVMNAICEKIGKSYDDGGNIAKEGLVSRYLLNELNELAYYKHTVNAPKSLGKEWVIKNVDPLLDCYELSESDLLRTFCEHIAFQIGRSLKDKPPGKLLITGGGAYNDFLLHCIIQQTSHQLVIPEKKTLEFKEALIFAFLGVLRLRNEVNCLSSVTGAQQDNCGGAIYTML